MKQSVSRYISLFSIFLAFAFSTAALAEDVRIALRAHKGAEKALQQWQATADYLSEKIPGYNFILVPFEINSSLNQAVSRGEYHFTLTNPAASVEHIIRYGAQPLATLVNKRQGKGYSKFGSVIFTRSDRNDINELKDLKGKTFVGADEQGFGGWRVAWLELLKNKINPYRDFKALNFAGGKQQRVVYSVRDAKADAGSVRTDMLERMAATGKINLQDYKVIGEKQTEGFPFLHSTALYPEWLFSATKKIDDKLKTQVVLALFSIPSDGIAAQNGKYIGWISPLDYSSVEQLLKTLAVGPFQAATVGKVQWIFNQYGAYLIVSLVITVLLTLLLIYLVRQNRLIALAQEKLLSEIDAREALELQLIQAQKIESLGQLTGGIAHDFNNMLASMLGFTELALSSDTVRKDGDITKYLNQVMASGESAKIIVSQMLAYSRTSDKVIKTEIVLVSSIIRTCYELLRPLLPSSIDLIVNKEDNDLYVNVDKVMMEQVLMNLCLNAKDALSGNKGKITISSELVELDQTLCNSCFQTISGTYVAIVVEDNGCGIDEDVKNRLFEPYYSTKEAGKGTGMGLSMVHGLVHKHNGHIQVDSELGKRTSIKILLPQAFKSEASFPNNKKDDSLTAAQNKKLDGKHILIVDDEIYITNYLCALLQMHGYKVTSLNSSRDALSFFEKHHDEIDLVLTDQTMPDLTGIEMVNKIRNISADVPVILCSGYSEDVNKITASDLKISTFLEKPVKSKDLLNTINRLIS